MPKHRNHSRSKSRSPRKSRSSRPQSPDKVPEYKVYTLITSSGEIGNFKNKRPGQAALKASKEYFKKNEEATKTVKIRQKSPGKGHNDIYIYKIKQEMVKPNKFQLETRGAHKGTKVPKRTGLRVSKIPASKQ